MVTNSYLPHRATIDEIVTETEDRMLKTFTVSFVNPEDTDTFQYQAGQFAELSIPGKGESPIGIASSPSEKGILKFTVNKTGTVTGHLHNMEKGDCIGVRGPLGNSYPWNELEGKNVVIIGGGFAFSTLRASIVYMLAHRDRFNEITIIYGARSPGLLLYKEELKAWEAGGDIKTHITVDTTDDPSWRYNVGFVPTITEEMAPPANKDTYAIVCGPPVMIRFTQPVLDKLGYHHQNIFNSLERRMKCGIGVCGRCNIGEKFVCKDGPVFTLDQLNRIPQD